MNIFRDIFKELFSICFESIFHIIQMTYREYLKSLLKLGLMVIQFYIQYGVRVFQKSESWPNTLELQCLTK